MKRIHKITVSCLMSAFLCSKSLAITIYVDQMSGNDLNDGLTPGTAVATITQGSALISASDTMNIGPGTYSTSTGESYPVNFTHSVNIEGAGPDQTIIDGEQNSNLLSISGGTASVSIAGLSIINGDGPTGGGLTVGSISRLTLSNCRFDNNRADIGGGMIVFDTPKIAITNCLFDGNNASIGGAVQIQINSNIDVIMDVSQSTFSNNTGNIGTALQFQENGAGIHTLNISQSRFYNNDRTGVNYQTNGGTSFGQITNSLFVDHPETALRVNSSDVDIINNTFVNNQRALFAGAQATIANSIFWDNQIELSGIGSSVSFSIIQDLDIDGHIDDGNNLDLAPLLDINHRLMQCSPAIDMGSDAAINALSLTQDIDLEDRIVDALGLNRPEGVVDIGADEVPDLIFADGFELFSDLIFADGFEC